MKKPDDGPQPIPWANSSPEMLTKVLGRKYEKFRCLSCDMLISPKERDAYWWASWWDKGPYHDVCPMNPMITSSGKWNYGKRKKGNVDE